MSVFLIGVIGGLLVEFLNVYRLRTKKYWPIHYKTLKYWIPTIVMILFGGVVSVMLNPSSVWINLYIGASAPTIIDRMLKGKM